MDSASSQEEVKSNGGDIEVPMESMNDFFFMDADEEDEKYGANTKVPAALSGNALKTDNSKVSD